MESVKGMQTCWGSAEGILEFNIKVKFFAFYNGKEWIK